MSEIVIGVDFDNTIAGYDSGNYSEESTGEPMAGAIAFLKALKELGFRVEIFSARASGRKGRQTIWEWVGKYAHGLVDDVTHEKRYTFKVIVDDRAIHADGNFKEIVKEILRRVEKE